MTSTTPLQPNCSNNKSRKRSYFNPNAKNGANSPNDKQDFFLKKRFLNTQKSNQKKDRMAPYHILQDKIQEFTSFNSNKRKQIENWLLKRKKQNDTLFHQKLIKQIETLLVEKFQLEKEYQKLKSCLVQKIQKQHTHRKHNHGSINIQNSKHENIKETNENKEEAKKDIIQEVEEFGPQQNKSRNKMKIIFNEIERSSHKFEELLNKKIFKANTQKQNNFKILKRKNAKSIN
ncbi:hypothetical protein M0813_14555 [Anaeramoeba flamelloides]|uniref:Uncharacterized protein n=1 Tax=Anaeramoeba flamelloides TaxID=1746091 RepID=A0ABQ8Z522_9EUKA|nr:hypothetical protein M0813_14555 [Anaeramoeba flamelloides]